MNKFNINIPLYKPFIHQPNIHQSPKFQSNELYSKFEENQKQFQKTTQKQSKSVKNNQSILVRP